MNKEFIPYEQALELKELGFDEECVGFYWYNGSFKCWDLELNECQSDYSNTIFAPLYQQAFRWFREKYKLFAYFVDYDNDNLDEMYYMFTITGGYHYEDFTEYHEAELACLKKLIEIVKNK